MLLQHFVLDLHAVLDLLGAADLRNFFVLDLDAVLDLLGAADLRNLLTMPSKSLINKRFGFSNNILTHNNKFTKFTHNNTK